MVDDITKLLESGLGQHQAGRLQDARAVYESVLSRQPQHPDALHLLGVVALQTGRHDEAVNLIERAIKARPDEPQFYNMCGEAYIALGKIEQAIKRYQKALTLAPDFAGALNNLGNALQATGRLEDAADHYRRALALQPDLAMARNNLGVVLKDLGQLDDAVTQFEQALVLVPDYVDALSNLGSALLRLERTPEAIRCLRRALGIQPDVAHVHSNLGTALRQLQRIDEAARHYKKAVSLQPNSALAHYNLGIAQDEMGRPQLAVASYERALAIDDKFAPAHNNLANALDELGRRADAVAHYKQALAIDPDYAEAHRNLSRVQPDATHIPAIEILMAIPSLGDTDAMHYHFALGNIHHSTCAYDKAFAHFAQGNGIKRRNIDYHPQHFSAYVNQLINVYSQDYFATDPGGGSDTTVPVFILGMPRSGTSLVEQIVASHPAVFGAGELPHMGRFEQEIATTMAAHGPYPACMPRGRVASAADFARRYARMLQSLAPDAERITDKMPDNFQRIGLIKTLFPGARIVHCRRNALDTCVSNYLHYFATGNHFTFDLQELGRFYLDYTRLMAHWEAVFGADILNVQYEALVTDCEAVSRQIIAHMALPWDDHCLAFYANPRAVNTFSSAQVRQPVYRHAIDRWRHYATHLGPLISVLEDAGIKTSAPRG